MACRWLAHSAPIVVVVTGELCYALHEHVNLVLRAGVSLVLECPLKHPFNPKPRDGAAWDPPSLKHTVPVGQHLSAGIIRAWSCALLKRNVRQDMRKTLMWGHLTPPCVVPWSNEAVRRRGWLQLNRQRAGDHRAKDYQRLRKTNVALCRMSTCLQRRGTSRSPPWTRAPPAAYTPAPVCRPPRRGSSCAPPR